MSNTINTNDQAVVSINTAKKAIQACIQAEKDFPGIRQPIFLSGPPGQGKSAAVDQLVEDLNRDREALAIAKMEEGDFPEDVATLDEIRGRAIVHDPEKYEKILTELDGPRWCLFHFRLGQCDPTDIKGVPVYLKIGDKEFCSFAPPQAFPYEEMKRGEQPRVIIFLDELPQAVPTIQNLASNIIDGKVGDYNLDVDKTYIMAAGNRAEDLAAVHDMPRNVASRLVHLSIKTSFEDWKEWAIHNKINSLVIGFLENHSGSFFNEKVPEKAGVYATPRSWHKVSCQMDSIGKEWFERGGLGKLLLSGTVGQAAATSFFKYAVTAANEFSVNDIMEGKKVKIPDRQDITYGILVEATYRINDWVQEATTDELLREPDLHTRANIFVEAMGEERISAINNIYKWTAQDGIEKAFSALLNKYQKEEVKRILRPCMMNHSAFKPAKKSYMNIHKTIVKGAITSPSAFGNV